MNPLSKEQLKTLSHDLSSDWTCVHGAMHILSERSVLPVDRPLYEDMFDRNTISLQTHLLQLAGHLPLAGLLTDISTLLSALIVQKSFGIMAQLDPLFLELNYLLREASV